MKGQTKTNLHPNCRNVPLQELAVASTHTCKPWTKTLLCRPWPQRSMSGFDKDKDERSALIKLDACALISCPDAGDTDLHKRNSRDLNMHSEQVRTGHKLTSSQTARRSCSDNTSQVIKPRAGQSHLQRDSSGRLRQEHAQEQCHSVLGEAPR